jgi:cysteine desulfuration protein SufE
MTPAENEKALIEAYSLIPDAHERMSAIVSSCGGTGISAADRREEDLVPGCVSRVWLTGTVEAGVLHLCWDADSPLVKGLAGLVCQVYHGTLPTGAASHRTGILAGLQLDRQLSPTRLNGLENVGHRIQQIAASMK